jgi:ribonuclease HII
MPPKSNQKKKQKKNKKKAHSYPWHELIPHPVIGVDEVGRGCLAGPVYAAAVILEPGIKFKKYSDSKLLSAERRTEIAHEIKLRHPHCIGIASVEEINELNILWASMLAMKRAIEGLKVSLGHVIVDGNTRIPDLAFPQTTIVDGDYLAAPISAASIIAKVARDEYMTEMAKTFVGYGFEQHKGYATKRHAAAIAKLGPTSFHRANFLGVKEFLADAGTDL